MNSKSYALAIALAGFLAVLASPAFQMAPAQEKPGEPGRTEAKPAPDKPAPGKSGDDKAGTEKAGDDKPKVPAGDGGKAVAGDGGKAAAEARAALRAASKRLLELRSLKAKIVEQIAIGDRRFKAEGTYLQGSNLRLRLELQVKAGGLEGTLLEVCDGGVLYSQYSVGDKPRITRRDVKQILDAVKAAPATARSQLVAELGLGGLPSLLASVEQSMAFTKVREETIEGQAFTVLEGVWGQEFMNQWKAINKKAERLPDHIPDSVRIYLDGKTMLPRRFVYLKQAVAKGPYRPMVTLDFQDLELNVPLDDEEFDFVPPDTVPQEDITKMYLDRLRGPSGESATEKGGSAPLKTPSK